ncbi:MAG: hypothetical protein ACRDMZ_10880 [Solirubrobacteraceae bacterium]
MSEQPAAADFEHAPDEGVLETLEPSSTDSVQPGWVRDLVGPEPPHAQRLSGLRCGEYRGHEIEIVTTYEISIDGTPVHFHASVGDDGRLRCHESPYAAVPSAIDLVKHLMDLYPDAFGGAGHGSGHAHPEPAVPAPHDRGEHGPKHP